MDSILHQLDAEVKAAAKLEGEHEWTTKAFVLGRVTKDFGISVYKLPIPLIGPFIGQLWLRISAYLWLRNNIEKYDFILFRYPFFDPFQLMVLMGVGNILTVHHTNEIEELALQRSIGGRLKYILERFFGHLALGISKGIVAVTPEIGQYVRDRVKSQLPVFLYPNGICVDDIPVADDRRSGTVKLVFVAAKFQQWQGLDQVLDSAVKSQDDFVLHLIGHLDGFAHPGLSDSRVIRHGYIEETELGKLLELADLGISSLALDRKGLTQACPLKTREYFSSGIAVYGNYCDPALPDNFPYYMRGPAEIKRMLTFAKLMRNVTRETIRETSRPYISKDILLEKLVKSLSKNMVCTQIKKYKDFAH